MGGEVKDIADVDVYLRDKSITGGIAKGYDLARKGMKNHDKKKKSKDAKNKAET